MWHKVADHGYRFRWGYRRGFIVALQITLASYGLADERKKCGNVVYNLLRDT